MQKNWYLVYTKPKCEKKVTSLLTKRKIENFCPQNRRQIISLRKSKLIQEPLFSSYVFINTEETNLPNILNMENILNLVYWKGNPAIINDEEINIIKEFIVSHNDIRMEKTLVQEGKEPKILSGPEYTMNGNLLKLKNRSVRINLPSLGYTLIADVGVKEELVTKTSIFAQEIVLQ